MKIMENFISNRNFAGICHRYLESAQVVALPVPDVVVVVVVVAVAVVVIVPLVVPVL